MDQLKPILKYHFWILCGVVILATIGAGFWAMSGQASEISGQVSAINAAQNDAKSVMSVSADVGEENSVSVHPNENTKEGMESEISEGKTEVLAAWQKLYDEQKDLLDWPLNALPKGVADAFASFQPERMKFELDNEQVEAPLNRRKQVAQILPNVLPRLAEVIRAEWQVAEIDGATNREPEKVEEQSPMETMMFNQPITEWSYNDQMQWALQLTKFKERNGNNDITGTPTTMQVLYVKENLVLLNSVLEIIKSVNADAMTPGQATVKTIQSIMIGKEAHEAQPMDLGTLGGEGGGGGPGGAMDDRMKMMQDYAQNRGKKKSEKKSTKVSTSELEAMDPANLRYVNEKFEPIPSSEYRNAANASQLSDKSWMAVVKRVPVRLRLMIDERQIDDLMEACANAKIPLEVRQVTIKGGDLPGADKPAVENDKNMNVDRGGPSAAGAGGAGGASMTLDEGDSGKGGAGGRLGDSGLDSENYKTAEFNANFEVPVEIYGFMKIYNKPTPEAIGVTDGESATTTDAE